MSEYVVYVHYYVTDNELVVQSCRLSPVLGHTSAGTVTLKHIYEIAKVKSLDPTFRNTPLESVCKTVIGSARSMGIKLVQ